MTTSARHDVRSHRDGRPSSLCGRRDLLGGHLHARFDGDPGTFTSSCPVTYTPTAGAGTHTVTGSYDEVSSAVTPRATSRRLRLTVTQRDPDRGRPASRAARDRPGLALHRDREDTDGGQPVGSERLGRLHPLGRGHRHLLRSPSCALVPDASEPTLELLGHLHADRGCGTHTVPGRLQRGLERRTRPASSTDDFTVTKRDTQTTVTCVPGRSRSTRARSAPRSSMTSTAGKVQPGRRGRLLLLGTGTFSSPSCTLAPVASDPDSSCQVGYRPTAGAGSTR